MEQPRSVVDAIFAHRGTLLILGAAPVVGAAVEASPPTVASSCAGAALVLAGSCLRFASIRQIGKRARVSRPGAAELATGGPYAWVRNPIYVANLSVAAGLALLGAGPWVALALAVYVLLVYSFVVRAEESRLAQIFGADYQRYRERVGRWIPTGIAAPGDAERWPWSQVFWRERGYVVGVLVLVGLALLVSTRTFPATSVLDVLDDIASRLGVPRAALLVAGMSCGGLIEALVQAMKRARKVRERARVTGATAIEALSHVVPLEQLDETREPLSTSASVE